MLEFAQTLHAAFGWWPKLLDVGGSLATQSTRYLNSREIKLSTTFLVPLPPPDVNDSLLPHTYAQVVTESVGQFCAEHGLALPRLVCEVGRSLTGNAQMLLSSVLNTRAGDDFDYAVMDAGVSVASIVTSEYHELFPLQQRSGAKRCHRIVGPICHMGDTLYMAHYQPALHKGDGVAIMDSGAYFIADAASFSFAQPAVVGLYADGRQTLIRHAESNEHLISLDQYETLGPNTQ
jgi:diaminopimelate decarboxylase